jgi:hypothetical protein
MNTITQESPYEIKKLHRGVYGTLWTWTFLPVGWSIFSDELTTLLQLDFDKFDTIDKEKLESQFLGFQGKFEEWFMKMPNLIQENIDLKTYFTLIAIQNGIKKRLNIIDDWWSFEDQMKRNKKYDQKENAKLSDFKDGGSFCAERAALWQHLLQELWIPSIYMSGVSYYEKIDDGANHSWIILYPNTDRSLIWDIARPHDQHPNLYKNNGWISMDLFEWKDNMFLKTQKLLSSSERYFWISDDLKMVSEGFTPRIISQTVKNILN